MSWWRITDQDNRPHRRHPLFVAQPKTTCLFHSQRTLKALGRFARSARALQGADPAASRRGDERPGYGVGAPQGHLFALLTAHHIKDSIDALKGEVTVVIIAHRLSTVKNADRVYVLDEGRVIEAGTYHELRSRENGEFREMVEMQSL